MIPSSYWLVWVVSVSAVVIVVLLVAGVLWRLYFCDEEVNHHCGGGELVLRRIYHNSVCPTTMEKDKRTMEQRVKSILHDAILINQYVDRISSSTTTSDSKKRQSDNRQDEESRGWGPTTSRITTPIDKPQDATASCHDVMASDDASSISSSTSSSASSPSNQVDDDEAPMMKEVLSRRLDEFDRRVRLLIPDIEHRHVPWGGKNTSPWYTRDLLWKYYAATMELQRHHHHETPTSTTSTTTTPASANTLNKHADDADDDRWATNVHFPRSKCWNNNNNKKKNLGGCRIEESILYSLEWRQVYQPWRVTPSMLKENQLGFVYANGITTASRYHSHQHHQTTQQQPQPTTNELEQQQQHGIVWYRPGRLTGSYQDPVSYYRCAFHSIERAIAQTGTFVAVVDAANVVWHKVPNLHYWARQTIAMLKDHYPHRLGYILILNMSPIAEIVLQMVRPLLPVRVRGLLRFVKTKSELETYLGKQAIENDNRYHFQAEQYYEPARFHWSDKEGEQYLKFIEGT